jgi:hypothetical protein
MASSPGTIELQFKPENSWRQFELGFIEKSNPRAYKKLLTVASLNAVRTVIAPMKAAAPVKTGRLQRSITAKSGKFSRPSATVGPRPGRSRADARGAWYRYFITSGHKTRLASGKAVKGISWAEVAAGKSLTPKGGTAAVPARPFVTQTAESATNQSKMLDAFYATVERYFNDTVFRHKLTKFKRR